MFSLCFKQNIKSHRKTCHAIRKIEITRYFAHLPRQTTHESLSTRQLQQNINKKCSGHLHSRWQGFVMSFRAVNLKFRFHQFGALLSMPWLRVMAAAHSYQPVHHYQQVKKFVNWYNIIKLRDTGSVCLLNAASADEN